MTFVSTDKNNLVRLKIIVRPKAKRPGISGLHDNMIKLSVAAPPVDGKANREVIAYLADFFDLKKKEISIVAGQHSKKKICRIWRLTEEQIRQKVKTFFL